MPCFLHIRSTPLKHLNKTIQSSIITNFALWMRWASFQWSLKHMYCCKVNDTDFKLFLREGRVYLMEYWYQEVWGQFKSFEELKEALRINLKHFGKHQDRYIGTMKYIKRCFLILKGATCKNLCLKHKQITTIISRPEETTVMTLCQRRHCIVLQR